MVGSRALGLVPTHWWPELDSVASCCRTLRCLLVPVCWYLDLGPIGGQGHVLGWLWAQEVLVTAY